jgi:ketosteroid isomerase-like protein
VRTDNVELVRRLYSYGPEVLQVFRQGGDLSAHPWLSLWHPDCVLEELAESPDVGAHRGRQGIIRYFAEMFEIWPELRYTPTEIVEGPHGVLVTTDMRGRSKAGVETEMRVFQVFRMRDGMVLHATGFTDRGQALEAVGLSG